MLLVMRVITVERMSGETGSVCFAAMFAQNDVVHFSDYSVRELEKKSS